MSTENFGGFVRRVRDTGVVQLPVTVLDCSADPNYPAASAGDVYRVTGAGRVGGGAGPKVEVGDVLVCHTDSAAGNHATVGLNWIVQQHNLDPATFEAAGAAATAQAAAEATAAADATTKANAAQAAAEATAAADATTKANARMAANGSNAALPTADPVAAGALWSDAGIVKVSAG